MIGLSSWTGDERPAAQVLRLRGVFVSLTGSSQVSVAMLSGVCSDAPVQRRPSNPGFDGRSPARSETRVGFDHGLPGRGRHDCAVDTKHFAAGILVRRPSTDFETDMQRRSFLHWASGLLSAAYAGLLTIPGIGFLTEPLRRSQRAGKFRRLVRLADLEVGVPRKVLISDRRVDAWTKYPEGVVGAVWVNRRSETLVDVFSVVCPHLGCPVDYLGEDRQFYCPCHEASYRVDGTIVAGPQRRGLDRLETQVESIAGEAWVSVVFAKFELGSAEQIPLV